MRLQSVIFVQTLEDKWSVDIRWIVQHTDHQYRVKPLHYIARLLSRPGQGSLRDGLNARGWVKSLSVWMDEEDIDMGFVCLFVQCNLTEIGRRELIHHNELLH